MFIINNNKVKNMIIIVLVLLNILLLVFNYKYDKEYQISASEITDIGDFLSNNKITLNANLIKKFSPLQQLDTIPIEIPQIELGQILLGDYTVDRVKSVDSLGKDILKQGRKTLTMDKNNFFLDNQEGTGDIELDKETATKAADEIVKKFKDYNLLMKLERIYNKDDYYILEYRCVFKGKIFYSSFMRFKVTKNGVVQIKSQLYKAIDFDVNYRNIYSSSEALMAFFDQYKKIYGEVGEAISINEIDIVYKNEETSYNNKVQTKATPYYRIYVSNSNEPMFVNAYLSKGAR